MTTSPNIAPSIILKNAIRLNTPKIEYQERQLTSLVDALYDGFYMLFLLKKGNAPIDVISFKKRIEDMLLDYEKKAKKLPVTSEDIYLAKYAFCAIVDEIVLSSTFSIRDEWERQPLQLTFFGDQLAGENFYTELEELRLQGASRIQVLEVFHYCLLLGFQGKYILEGQEKLNFLVSRLGEEIAYLKGKRPTFAPQWAIPDEIRHILRHDVPVWIVAGLFALFGLIGYIVLDWMLTKQTESMLIAHQNIIHLAPKVANITITLP